MLWNICGTTDQGYVRKHFPVLSSFMTYPRVCNTINTTGTTSGAGTAYPSGTPEFTPGDWGQHKYWLGINNMADLVSHCPDLFLKFLFCSRQFCCCLYNYSRSFPPSWLIPGFVTRITRRVPLVEQELPTLPVKVFILFQTILLLSI
jgi:hypothetical protein